ncbi:MAG TPA: DNA repair protein RecN [Sporichthyaceae bacterium]|nr:DNA repair protein RecN [Sporichthyaceae bacterium]
MFEEITIRGLGVIEEAVLELGPGLTVLTGETGAGKTMVMTGLGLLLGGRADAGLVRPGSRLVVEGRVRVPAVGPVADRVAEAGGELDDGVLILARTVTAEGRSRAHVGGRSVPVGVLADLGEHLVALHGQHDQQHLRSPALQRELLDRYGGTAVAEPLTAYRAAYQELLGVRERLGDLLGRARERAREADALRLGLAEVAAVNPQPDEESALIAEMGRLEHADALRDAASTAHEILGGEPDSGVDAATLLQRARRALDAMSEHDPQLADLAKRAAEIFYLQADLIGDLASYAAGVEVDPARLAAANDRRAALTRLLRKYGETTGEVVAWANEGALRLAELDSDVDTTAALREREAALQGLLAEQAELLSAARRAAAARLQEAIAAELSGLAMAGAHLSVMVRQIEDRSGFGPHGADEVEMLLAAHSDAPARPVQRAASGGELSRIMLAVQVALAGVDPVATFVFDEVDAGVGGRAALEVGRRLARLAEVAQVVVVTHLPQVAAFADQHLSVSRTQTAGARTEVHRLAGEDRVRELSRMLAGQTDSATAQAHAVELLVAARRGAQD